MKRKISLLLCVAMLLSLCSVPAFAEDVVSYTESGAKVITYGQQIELKVPIYQRSGIKDPIEDNYWTHWVQENFGDKYNIKVTYIPISRTDEVNDFTLKMGSKETAPDMIFHYDNPQLLAYIDQEFVQPIDEEMVKEYMPDYLTYVGDDAYQAGKYMVDGKKTQMYFPAARDDADNWATIIRTDWLEKVGKEMPVTLEDYLDVLRAFRDANLGGDYTIPATQNLPSTTGMRADARRTGHTDPREIAIYSDLQVVSLDWEPIKKAYETLNTMYNEGLISKEFALDADGSQAKSDFVNGKAGVYGFYLSSNSDVISTLMENCPDAKIDILDPRSGVPAGENLYDYKADPIGISTGISAYCDHPEAVMMYINWMAQPEVLEYLEYGEEGKHYNVVDGIKVLNSDYDGPDRFVSTNANIDLFVMVSQTRRDATSLEAMSATYCPIGYEYLMQEIFEGNALKTYIHNYRFTTPIKSQSEYGEDLRARFQSISAQVITCPTDQFDSLYDSLVADYVKAGLEEIHQEKAEVYDLENP
ncbi:MAG: extracellular solute-binding protein [Clostridia bacterium]|nr:extracellular solute-binding protein [Clostridia bacterium]